MCESEAERAAYPILKELSEKYCLNLEVQSRVRDWDYNRWIYEKYDDAAPDEIESRVEKELDNNDHFEDAVYYGGKDYHDKYVHTFEKYRLDFLLSDDSGDIRIDVEIDGARWHNQESDFQRDNYLSDKGFDIIRIAAVEVLYSPGRAAAVLGKQIGELIGENTGPILD